MSEATAFVDEQRTSRRERRSNRRYESPCSLHLLCECYQLAHGSSYSKTTHSLNVAALNTAKSIRMSLCGVCKCRPAEGGAVEGEEPSQAEAAPMEGATNGVAETDPPLPPQDEAGGWSAVQDAGNGTASDTTAARFAPGAKFVVNTA